MATDVERLRANVKLSEGHVAKQDAIIERLDRQGHRAMGAEARAVLATMHGHLALERQMLVRLEAKAAASVTAASVRQAIAPACPARPSGARRSW